MPKHVGALQKHDKQPFPLKTLTTLLMISLTFYIIYLFFFILFIYSCLQLQTFASQDGLTLAVIATFQAPHVPHG